MSEGNHNKVCKYCTGRTINGNEFCGKACRIANEKNTKCCGARWRCMCRDCTISRKAEISMRRKFREAGVRYDAN